MSKVYILCTGWFRYRDRPDEGLDEESIEIEAVCASLEIAQAMAAQKTAKDTWPLELHGGWQAVQSQNANGDLLPPESWYCQIQYSQDDEKPEDWDERLQRLNPRYPPHWQPRFKKGQSHWPWWIDEHHLVEIDQQKQSSSDWKPAKPSKYHGGDHCTGFDCTCGAGDFWISSESGPKTCDECGRVYRLSCCLEVDESNVREALE